MAFSYLDPTTVFDAYKDSEKYMRPLFEPLQEFERIARNKPHPGLDKAYPKVTDGTTSSVIEKTPRRILQQIPTGLAISDTDEWLTQVAGFLLTNKIIPNANSQYPFLQKCQAAIAKALTYGAQPAYVPFVKRGKYTGTDLLLPYVKDVFLEPGKVSDTDSNFIMMRAWYQKRDIEAIIAAQSKLEGSGIDSGWDVKALNEIKDSISQKDDLSTTPNEKDKNNRNGGIEIVHCFQRGIGGKFYSIHMKTKKVVRTRVNKDPRGEIPIHYLYASADVSNPLGRGFIEMVGAMQNLMDAEVQMYQYNRALMLNPPMIKRGEWNKAQAKMAPNILVDLGNNPQAAWEPVQIDNSALANFANNYGLMQSQIYQLLSAPSSQISAQVGSVTQSKTQAGVKQADNNLNVDDTYIRNQTEAWLEKIYETQLNLYFAEKSGVEELQLDEDTANDIKNIKGCEEMVSDDNKIRIDFSSETEQLNFRIDPGSSEKQDNTEEIAELKEIIADVNANPNVVQSIQSTGKQLNIGEVYKQLFEKLGLKEMDKILTDIPVGPDGQPQVAPPAPDTDKISVNYNDLDPQSKAAYLSAMNIQTTPEQIAQFDAQKAAAEQSQGQASSMDDHPLVKLMSSLNIKFTDLPQDSQEEVLKTIGIPTTQMTPTTADTSIKAIQTAHDINSSQEQQMNQTAQMAQADQHKQIDAQLQQQSQTQQAVQNQNQNKIAEKGIEAKAAQPTSPTTKKAKSSPTKSKPAPAQPNNDAEHMKQLTAMGLNDQQAQQALALIDAGYPLEDVLKMIGVAA